MIGSPPSRASCRFDRCSESIISRVVLALVDQLCADADIDITLLDALDYPLGETLAALHEFDVLGVTVGVSGGELHVDIELSRAVSNPFDLLGDATASVASFFDIRSSADSSIVALVGDLG